MFGCLAYVLDPVVQNGKKSPQWKPKSRRGQFLGRSLKHASNIALIQNLNTGFVLAQFHVVYDDFYTTLSNSNENKSHETWPFLFDTSRELLVDESDQLPLLHDSWLDTQELEQRNRSRRLSNRLRPQPYATSTLPVAVPVSPELSGQGADVNDRESNASLLTEDTRNVQPSANINQSPRGVTFEEDQSRSASEGDPVDVMSTLEEYLEQENPELAENSSPSIPQGV